jgi:hypothetical protein
VKKILINSQLTQYSISQIWVYKIIKQVEQINLQFQLDPPMKKVIIFINLDLR